MALPPGPASISARTREEKVWGLWVAKSSCLIETTTVSRPDEGALRKAWRSRSIAWKAVRSGN